VARGGNTGQRRSKIYLLFQNKILSTSQHDFAGWHGHSHERCGKTKKIIKLNNLNKLTTLIWHKVEDKVFRFCDKGGKNYLKQKLEKILILASTILQGWQRQAQCTVWEKN
jgi:hypothetical protein